MSGFNNDMNPSLLGGGAPGIALKLLGGGGGSSGGSGMVGGSARGRNRFALRNAFKTNRIGTTGLRALCGPFRAAMSAGDVLGRKDQSAGGANMVTAVNRAVNHGSSRLGGAVSTANVGDAIVIGGETFITGTGAGQTPLQSGNPRHVYDGSDFIRYKKLAAINKNYNDKSFGGPSKAGAGGSGVFTALGRVRR